MIWPYALKGFEEQLNVLKVDDDSITLMEKFTKKKAYITLKNTTNGAVQFMSWMKYYNAIII